MPTRDDMAIGLIDVDCELIWSLQAWREYTDKLKANISEDERKNMESIDCIKWFCTLVRERLEKWKKDGKYNWLLDSESYSVKNGCLIGDENV